MPNFHREPVWRKACALAIDYGLVHAALRIKPWSRKRLWQSILTRIADEETSYSGPSIACDAHPYCLRSVYGGAYNGAKISLLFTGLRVDNASLLLHFPNGEDDSVECR